MNLALVAGGAQLLGGLLGGGRRDKRAMRQLRELQDAADFVFDRAQEDQARAIEYRMSDEARLKEATGYDLRKLRDDAKAAGFNPLTVLQATGAAGYDGRGAVITTPFISMADAARTRVDARLGGSHLAVDNAGYVGDAIANAGNAYVSTALSQAQMLADREIQLAMASAMKSPGVTAQARQAVKSPFDVASQPGSSWLGWDADKNISVIPGWDITADGLVPVYPMEGGPVGYINQAVAKEYGLVPGSVVPTGLLPDEYWQARGAVGAGLTDAQGWFGKDIEGLQGIAKRAWGNVHSAAKAFDKFTWGGGFRDLEMSPQIKEWLSW